MRSSIQGLPASAALAAGALAAGALAAIALAAIACGRGASPTPARPTSATSPSPPATLSPFTPPSTPPVVTSAKPQPTLKGRIAFDNDNDIFVLELSTGVITRLTDHPAREINPVWSPDGQSIAYRSNRESGHDDIYVMDADGRNQRNLTATASRDEWGPAWSPDGQWLALNQSATGFQAPLRIYLVHPDGSDGRALRTAFAEFPHWSPDGSQIVFASMLPGGRGLNPDYDLHVVNVATGEERGLSKTTATYEMYPAWSPDGSTIAFMAGAVHSEPTSIWIMDADGTNRREVVDGRTALPRWSPDGRHLVYLRFGRDNDIEVIWPDGTGRIALGLTGLSPSLGFPSWTAEGERTR